MSAALRRERAWRYAANEPTGDDATTGGTTWTLAPAPTSDLAYWCAYAPQEGRESAVALRRTAILRAVFTVDDAVPIRDTAIVRHVRTGTLYHVTSVRPIPTARETVFEAESVERGQYAIDEDVPEHTADSIIITPALLNLTVGTKRYLRASVQNASGVVLQDRPVAWDSSDRAVALVFGTGQVEAISPGVATITATSGDAVETATVTVSA